MIPFSVSSSALPDGCSGFLRAVIYARFSPGKNQKEISIEGQLRECREFADRNNYEVVGEYIDRRISGRSDNRADFQRLMRDCEKRCFDVVIVWKFDRFFRNRQESAIYKKHLADFGVKLVSAKEFIPDGSGGIIMAGMIETVAEWYSANLSENVTRGMYETASKAQSTGHLPLGYVTGPDKRLKIQPVEAEAVQIAFQMYSDGANLKEIADALNESGHTTKTGRPFCVNSFGAILTNPKYIGVYKWHDDIEIRDGCPRIVSDELFFSVQRRLERTRRTSGRGRATTEYFLSTKIFCGHCGKPMCGESALKRGMRYYYYACSEKKRFHNCKKKNVPKDKIENLVFEKTLAMLTDDNIAYIAREVERIAADENINLAALRQLEGQLAEVNKRLSNIGNAIAQGIITETTKELLVSAEAERAAINKKIAQERLLMKGTVKAENVACWLHSFKTKKRSDLEFKRQLFASLVHSVYVYDDHLKVIFNVEKYGAVEISFDELSSATSSDVVGLAQPAKRPQRTLILCGLLALAAHTPAAPPSCFFIRQAARLFQGAPWRAAPPCKHNRQKIFVSKALHSCKQLLY